MTLKERIIRHKRGKIFFIDSFVDYKDDYVKKTLAEMEKEGTLVRLAQGMYYLPIQTRLGILFPSVDEIVQAIARRDHANIMPSANTALHQLGFTTQVPTNYEYLTNGAARIVHLDKNTVRLLRQKISVERKALKIGNYDDFSNGFTPRLHLLR